MQCLKIFVMNCSLNGISCKQNQLRVIYNKNNWYINHSTVNSYPDVLIFSSGERLHYGKVELVLLYHVPNKFEDLDDYAHHSLFMFYQLRNECKLKVRQTSL